MKSYSDQPHAIEMKDSRRGKRKYYLAFIFFLVGLFFLYLFFDGGEYLAEGNILSDLQEYADKYLGIEQKRRKNRRRQRRNTARRKRSSETGKDKTDRPDAFKTASTAGTEEKKAAGSCHKWIRIRDSEWYFIDTSILKAGIRANRLWNDVFPAAIIPLGIQSFESAHFFLSPERKFLVFHSNKMKETEKLPESVEIKLPGPQKADRIWLFGLISGWGGKALDDSPSLKLMLEFADDKENLAYDIFCCDIWSRTHHNRPQEKKNRKVFEENRFHLDMTSFDLPEDRILKKISFLDVNENDSPLIAGITLQKILKNSRDSEE